MTQCGPIPRIPGVTLSGVVARDQGKAQAWLDSEASRVLAAHEENPGNEMAYGPDSSTLAEDSYTSPSAFAERKRSSSYPADVAVSF
jgi:hypothetical protein